MTPDFFLPCAFPGHVSQWEVSNLAVTAGHMWVSITSKIPASFAGQMFACVAEECDAVGNEHYINMVNDRCDNITLNQSPWRFCNVTLSLLQMSCGKISHEICLLSFILISIVTGANHAFTVFAIMLCSKNVDALQTNAPPLPLTPVHLNPALLFLCDNQAPTPKVLEQYAFNCKKNDKMVVQRRLNSELHANTLASG